VPDGREEHVPVLPIGGEDRDEREREQVAEICMGKISPHG
jgi:hypothetical protein